MRRGLIAWSKAELPEAVLDARVAAVQAALAAAHLDALCVYTTPARTSGVTWLTGFVPYWNEGLLVVPREGRPILVSALSNRVSGWIKQNAHVERVANNPRIGAEAGTFIAERKAGAKVGLVDLVHLPGTVAEGLASKGHAVSDGSALLAGVRAVADPAELALAYKAAAIAHRALSEIPRDATAAGDVVAAVDGLARTLGAEEVYPAIAADLGRSTRLVRLEGGAALGPRYAMRLSLAYKGTWVRMTRTVVRGPTDMARVAAAAEQFATLVGRAAAHRRAASGSVLADRRLPHDAAARSAGRVDRRRSGGAVARQHRHSAIAARRRGVHPDRGAGADRPRRRTREPACAAAVRRLTSPSSMDVP